MRVITAIIQGATQPDKALSDDILRLSRVRVEFAAGQVETPELPLFTVLCALAWMSSFLFCGLVMALLLV